MNPEAASNSGIEQNRLEGVATRALMITELSEYGLADHPKKLVDLLVNLEDGTHFNSDARMVEKGVANVLKTLERRGKIKFTSEQMREIALASFLSDIGKAFSSAVTKLFSIENIKNQNQTVLETIQVHFPKEGQALLAELKKVHVEPGVTMRKFWDMHVEWTDKILRKYKNVFTEDIIRIAASHHLERRLDPYKVLEQSADGKSLKISKEVSLWVKYAIFTLMAVDKFQARVERSDAAYNEAMNYLEGVLADFADDPVMADIIKVMYDLSGQNKLLPIDIPSSRKKKSVRHN
jgi:hypothetical protein